VRLAPPDNDEVQIIARGVTSAVAPAAGIIAVQRVMIEALFPAMTGFAVDVSALEPITATEFAQALAPRDLLFRTRGVQIMVLCALILPPLPEAVVDRVADFARELEVDENMIGVARRFADGSFGLASLDFERNGYTRTDRPRPVDRLWGRSAGLALVLERDLDLGPVGRDFAVLDDHVQFGHFGHA
jgi:hypothetical protein